MAGIFFLSSAQAKVFPSIGEVFPIKEESILEVIMKKLKAFEESGKLGGLQKELQERVKKAIERPKPVSHIRKTTKARTYTVDLSLTLQTAIMLPGDKVLAPAGTRINPLAYRKFSKAWLFIDGDEESQVMWALAQKGHKKIILVKGAPLKLSDKHNIKIYFDQEARLSNRFHLEQVPARITQDGSLLKVEELHLDEETKK